MSLELTTVMVFRKDKKRFDDLYKNTTEMIRQESNIPKFLYKKMTKTEFFSKILDVVESEGT